MPFNPYILLAAGGIWLASIVGGYFYGTHHEALSWRASIAEQKAEASTKLIAANKASADKDNANIVSALTVEEKHGQEIAAINADADNYSRKYADSLRRIARCGADRNSAVPPSAAHSDQPAPGPAGSADRLFEDAGRSVGIVGGNCNKLAATVRECVDWAARVGR